ncbi:putative odorant receptor 92a [Trichogramma pretiosum]|uniref:putative odorant receptor 92a n=1 Tax=Trichogramma pretiosum TaxID=7493 RepID=UPI000C71B0DE|nr:putative odorant receptor 92a [Trichogramma pretiosum]
MERRKYRRRSYIYSLADCIYINQRKKQEKLRYCSRVFEWNELLLSVIGLYPGKFSFARFYLNLAYFTTAMGLEYLDLVLSLGDFERVVLNLTENAAFTHIYAYTLSLWLGNREIGQLLGQVASDFAADYTDQEIATLRRYYFRTRVFIEFLFVNLFTTASSYFMQPFTGQMDQILGYMRGSSANSSIVYQLPYRFHAFHRVDEPASYLWTSAAYAPFVLVTFFNQSSGECCLIALVYHVAAQMAVLASRIRGIEPGNDCTEQLANCLRRHARLLRMGQQINKVFSAMLLVHLTGIILLVCLVGYQLLWCLANGEYALLPSFIVWMCLLLVSLYVHCTVGETLITESDRLHGAYYDCRWNEMPPSTARWLVLAMARSSRTLTLNAGSFSTLSLATYTSSLKASLGYLSVFRTVMQSES